MPEKPDEDYNRAKKDIAYFMRNFLNFIPRDDQMKPINALSEGALRVLIRKGRRWGGTKLCSGLALTLASQRPGLKIGIFSPGWDETEVFMDQVNEHLERSKIQASIITDDKMKKKFSNGSVILGRVLSKTAQGKRGRGFDVLIFTEGAYISDDEMHIARLSKLDNPKAIEIFESSPNGRNHMWRAENDPDYVSFHFKTLDNPLVSKKEYEKEKRLMTEIQIKQELEAEYIDDSTAPFPQALLDEAIKTSKLERYWLHCEDRTGVYVAGLDLGRKRDKSELYVWKVEKEGNLQGVYRKKFTYNPDDPRFWSKIIDHTEYVCKDFKMVKLLVDCTGLGDKVTIDMKNQFAEHHVLTRIEGFNFTYASKNKWEGLINQFSLKFERYKIHMPFDLEFVKQLKSIRFNSERSLYESIGKSPDILMAAALGAMAAPETTNFFYSKANSSNQEVPETKLARSYGA